MSQKESFRILHCINDLSNGGIQTFCLNVNKNIDKKKFIFDYFLPIGNSEYYKNEIEKLGAQVFNIKSEKIPKYIPKSLRIFYLVIRILRRNNHYSAIHIHQCKGVNSILLAAYLCKVPVRILHSHTSFLRKTSDWLLNLKIWVYSIINKIFANVFSTHKLGCSKEACKSLYGSNCFDDKKTEVIFNGIDLTEFKKEKYNVEDLKTKYRVDREKFNFINIGRFEDEKNPLFLIEVFNELIKIRDDVNLTIIGHGKLEGKIKETINKYNLRDKVKLLPHNSCVPEVLSTMDYFILPSLHEGLGIVLIEAQAMGLPCFASSTVPMEAQLGLCNYIPLEDGAQGWASYINNYIEQNIYQEIEEKRLNLYDIRNVANKLENIYKNKIPGQYFPYKSDKISKTFG